VSEQILNGTSAQLGYTVPMYSANVIMTKKPCCQLSIN